MVPQATNQRVHVSPQQHPKVDGIWALTERRGPSQDSPKRQVRQLVSFTDRSIWVGWPSASFLMRILRTVKKERSGWQNNQRSVTGWRPVSNALWQLREHRLSEMSPGSSSCLWPWSCLTPRCYQCLGFKYVTQTHQSFRCLKTERKGASITWQNKNAKISPQIKAMGWIWQDEVQ